MAFFRKFFSSSVAGVSILSKNLRASFPLNVGVAAIGLAIKSSHEYYKFTFSIMEHVV